tara:strand:- start:393 stop:926 length:534 start_codon:yes stop_codon:yes gene_type:complete
MRKLLLASAASLLVAACAGGGFQVDGVYRDEIATAALVSAILAEQTAIQIESGEIAPGAVPSALAANEALANVISGCRGPATTGTSGGATCMIAVVATAMTLETFLTGDEQSDQIDLGEALAFLGDALLIPDPRMIVLWAEIDRLEPGELLSLEIVAGAFAEMDQAQWALDDVVGLT